MGENELVYHIPGIVIVTQCNEIGIFEFGQNFFRWAYRSTYSLLACTGWTL